MSDLNTKYDKFNGLLVDLTGDIDNLKEVYLTFQEFWDTSEKVKKGSFLYFINRPREKTKETENMSSFATYMMNICNTLSLIKKIIKNETEGSLVEKPAPQINHEGVQYLYTPRENQKLWDDSNAVNFNENEKERVFEYRRVSSSSENKPNNKGGNMYEQWLQGQQGNAGPQGNEGPQGPAGPQGPQRERKATAVENRVTHKENVTEAIRIIRKYGNDLKCSDHEWALDVIPETIDKMFWELYFIERKLKLCENEIANKFKSITKITKE